MNRRHLIMPLLLVALGCVDTGQDDVVAPIHVAGTSVGTIGATGGVDLTLTRADLAFGPLYLCAGPSAGDLCDTARAEWLGTAVIDTLDPTPARAGELAGVSGSVQSYMYDLAISSQYTANDPVVLEAAEEIGASFVVTGTADVAGRVLPFRAAIDIQQSNDTELGVPVIRRSVNEPFDHELDTGEAGLLVQFDPTAWVQNIDFRPYAAEATCAIDGPNVVCAGETESVCDAATGLAETTRDCAALGQVCQAQVGCVDEVVIEAETEASRALRNALLTDGRPRFEWGFTP